MSFRCRRSETLRFLGVGTAGEGVERGRRVGLPCFGTFTRTLDAFFTCFSFDAIFEALSVGVRFLPAALDTFFALRYIFLRWSPTSRKSPRVLQHVCVVQDPLTPWHLQIRRIVFFTACRKFLNLFWITNFTLALLEMSACRPLCHGADTIRNFQLTTMPALMLCSRTARAASSTELSLSTTSSRNCWAT